MAEAAAQPPKESDADKRCKEHVDKLVARAAAESTGLISQRGRTLDYTVHAAFLPVASRHFLHPEARANAALLARLAAVPPGREGTGVMHLGGPSGTRGGFSLYVPETIDVSHPVPLVVALHGGGGHGGAFLWTWLRAARARGAIVLAPTSAGPTWSLRPGRPATPASTC